MNVSVIVPTYNRPQELQLCLFSLAAQSVLPDEVLIADDGSKDETRQMVEQFRNSGNCPFALKHIWQEDSGFRKPRILNETVRNASGEYLIFMDGDCMAHREFVRSHLLYAEPEAMLGGKRVDVGTKLSRRLLEKQQILNSLTFQLLWSSVAGDSRKVEESLRVESSFLRRLLHRDLIRDDGIWGCNFSVHKDLFYAINGCDEDFQDGSIEDNDLGIRVLNNGGKLKSVRALAVVFHLWHPSSWSFHNEKYLHNMNILQQRIDRKEARCVHGIQMFQHRNTCANGRLNL
ncbi:MAG: glycosyl transferase [Geobacter sp.]|nr:MAG: glycosyl transferase [Geobacter sp.]